MSAFDSLSGKTVFCPVGEACDVDFKQCSHKRPHLATIPCHFRCQRKAKCRPLPPIAVVYGERQLEATP